MLISVNNQKAGSDSRRSDETSHSPEATRARNGEQMGKNSCDSGRQDLGRSQWFHRQHLLGLAQVSMSGYNFTTDPFSISVLWSQPEQLGE